MTRRAQTSMIKVVGHIHRFTLYFERGRFWGQRPVVMHRGKVLNPRWRENF